MVWIPGLAETPQTAVTEIAEIFIGFPPDFRYDHMQNYFAIFTGSSRLAESYASGIKRLNESNKENLA